MGGYGGLPVILAAIFSSSFQGLWLEKVDDFYLVFRRFILEVGRIIKIRRLPE